MAASKEQIREWVMRGVSNGATHVIIVYDSWDHEDFPSYIGHGQSVEEKLSYYERSDSMRVMEVYNMSMDIESQLSEFRAWHV